MTESTEDKPKVWAIKLPDGTTQRFDDLPMSVIEGIARACPDVSQFVIASNPQSDLLSARVAWKAAREHAGFPVTPEEADPTFNYLYEQFVQVDDDVPMLYEDGTPKSADETSTPG